MPNPNNPPFNSSFIPLGPTGQFPRGKLDPSDEGELQTAVAADHKAGVVRVAFGSPVSWIGLPPKEARQFALTILKHADEIVDHRLKRKR